MNFQPLAYNLVVDALDDIKLAHTLPSRFSSLLRILRGTSSLPLQAATMAFINALSSGPEQLLTRLWARGELRRAGIEEDLARLRQRMGDPGLTKQLEIFEDEAA